MVIIGRGDHAVGRALASFEDVGDDGLGVDGQSQRLPDFQVLERGVSDIEANEIGAQVGFLPEVFLIVDWMRVRSFPGPAHRWRAAVG